MELVFDIETNHYKFDILDRMHCIVAQDIESQKVYSFGPDELHEGMELLMSADVLIGHNILLFDLPAIKQLYPLFNYTGEVRDTLIMSRMAKPKWFQHSLGKWGRTLHFKKGDYAQEYKARQLRSDAAYLEAYGEPDPFRYQEGDEWQNYSKDMLDYCVQDVRVNRRVYIECCKKMPTMFNAESLQLEQYVKTLMVKQRDEGIAFDQENATILMDKLMLRRTELAEEVSKTFKGFYKPGKLFTPKRDNVRLGYTKGSTVQKIIWTDFNPNSRDHVTYWLQKKYNWEPEEFTDGGKPKVSETVLESLVNLYPEAAPIAEYFMVSKRLSAIIDGKGSWFNKVTPEGRIHGTVNSTGTITYRGTHNNPNLGQIPKVGKPYGEACRSLFSHGMGDDWSFMGCDMSGIEFRLLAHYLHQFDGGALVDTVLNGDIHSVNQKAAGLPTRDLAKTFIYAFIYGGGDGKLGNIVGGDRAKGAKLRASFLRGMPALATLLTRVKKYRKGNNKTIRCLDGRHIPVDSEHVTLNYLLQTAGAILSKAWMREFHKLAEAAGFRWGVDYMQLLWVHDEVQCAVKTARSEELGKICVQAIENVGEHYKLKCPITGEFKVGQNWAETH